MQKHPIEEILDAFGPLATEAVKNLTNFTHSPNTPLTVEQVKEMINNHRVLVQGTPVHTSEGIKPLSAEMIQEILRGAMQGTPFKAPTEADLPKEEPAHTSFSEEVIIENIKNAELELEKAQKTLAYWKDVQIKKQQVSEEQQQKAFLTQQLQRQIATINELENLLVQYSEQLPNLLISDPAGAENSMSNMKKIVADINLRKAKAEELKETIERIHQV